MEENKLNIVFMGSPDFAVAPLESLHKEFGLSYVVTIPDKPQGRGKKLQPSPVKVKAGELGIPILQPDNLKSDEFANQIKSIEPDIICVVAFKILPKQVYNASKIASFNIHGSLLPKYRGAAPVNWTIINGDKISGLTSFLLADKVDTGNLLLKKSLVIPDNSTAGDLRRLLTPLSCELAVETVKLILNGNYTPESQDESLACPAPKLFPEMCEIDWNCKGEKLKNLINGVSPNPGAWTIWKGERMKVYRAVFKPNQTGNPSTFLIDSHHFKVFTNDGAILIKELQLPSRKRMPIEIFLQGYRGEKSGIIGSKF